MRNNESGFTLVGVLAVFTIISVFSVSLVMLSISSVKTSNSEHDNQSVFYIAEAGANYMVNEIEQQVNDIYDSNKNITEKEFFNKLSKTIIKKNETYNAFEKNNGELPTATISVSPLTDEKHNTYKITSEGTIHNQQRTVDRTFTIDWPEGGDSGGVIVALPPFAVYISGGDDESYDLQNGTINGDIGIISNKSRGIKLQGGININGDIYVPGADDDIVKRPQDINVNIKDLDHPYTIPELPPFPKFPENLTKLPDEKIEHSDGNSRDLVKENKLLIDTYITKEYTLTMNKNLEFKEIKIDENNELTIDTGNKDREIVVDKLNIKNGHIKLKGTGKLTFYVKDEIVMKSGSSINDKGDINRINIFYKDDEELNLNGDSSIYGSIYARKGKIKLQGSSRIHGNIFSGGEEIELQGGTYANSQLIFAPCAKVRINGSGTVNGMIISERFKMQGGGSVTFDEPFILDGPISPGALGKRNPGSGGESDGSGSSGVNSRPGIFTSPIREIEE